ncbi:MAG: hypothetical protein ACYTFT_01955 [Planctomycetota bacterium]|jgi:hypothetical protein
MTRPVHELELRELILASIQSLRAVTRELRERADRLTGDARAQNLREVDDAEARRHDLDLDLVTSRGARIDQRPCGVEERWRTLLRRLDTLSRGLACA